MRYQYLLLVSIGVLLIGCDSLYTSRMLVSLRFHESASPDTATAKEVAATVVQYAKEHGLSCAPNGDTLVYCDKQPVRVFATIEPDGVAVCYSAMGIPLESGKFDSRITQLKDMLINRFGKSAVATTQLKNRQCVLPQ